jgi:hypothetical protein
MKKGDFVWFALLCAITVFLIVPVLHKAFVNATNAHPYLMGFAKFAIMATMGELLTLRLINGKWTKTIGMGYKAFIWGVVGMLVVLMFTLFSEGVAGATTKGLLAGASGFGGKLLQAFFISTLMNVTFGPMFMAAHRISDTFIDMRTRDSSVTLNRVIEMIEWPEFIRFIVAKTIPFFWIPAHTIVFLLPPQYRVITAAYLSIALGLILTYARRRKT